MGKTNFFITAALTLVLCAQTIPPYSTPIADETNTLSPDERENLKTELIRLHNSGKASMAIYIIQTLNGVPIEEYSLKVAEKWGLGNSVSDNGLLLLIAKADRKMRLEVGSGLEGDIPDAYARRILDHDVRPWFRQGEFFKGLQASIFRVGEYIGTPLKDRIGQAPSAPGQTIKILMTLFLLFCIPVMFIIPVFLHIERKFVRHELTFATDYDYRESLKARLRPAYVSDQIFKTVMLYLFMSVFLGVFFYAGKISSIWALYIIPGLVYLFLYIWPMLRGTKYLFAQSEDIPDVRLFGTGSGGRSSPSASYTAHTAFPSGAWSASSSSGGFGGGSSFSGGGGFSGGGASSGW